MRLYLYYSKGQESLPLSTKHLFLVSRTIELTNDNSRLRHLQNIRINVRHTNQIRKHHYKQTYHSTAVTSPVWPSRTIALLLGLSTCSDNQVSLIQMAILNIISIQRLVPTSSRTNKQRQLKPQSSVHFTTLAII